MSILSRLFGRSSGSAPSAQPQPEIYNGFRIFPDPIREGGRYRIAARIEKDAEGDSRSHRLIRADTCEDVETARSLSLQKAKQIIDEQGESILG